MVSELFVALEFAFGMVDESEGVIAADDLVSLGKCQNDLTDENDFS